MDYNKQIYFDNACTSFPKPLEVSKAVYTYMTNIGSNINRGCYKSAYNTEEMVFETRELLCEMFGADDVKNVVFTRGITESLNIVIKGFFKPGDHVIVSSYEHNAVMRPLNAVGVGYDRIPQREDGSMDEDAVRGLIRDNTKAMIISHASNVCGLLMPLEVLGRICGENNIKLIVDSAQTAGTIDIDMKKMNIDVLTFAGHKGLMGPQGIGGMILTDEMAANIKPFVEGGTGSMSDKEVMPEYMPDKFEAGTLNIPGIAGLNASLKWIASTGIDTICEKENRLSERFIDGILDLSKSGKISIERKSSYDEKDYTSTVSINCLKHDNSYVAATLDEKYMIMTRVGLHCSPAAHKCLGTFPEGTIRFSFGYFNSFEEVDFAVRALHEILEG